MGGCPAPHLSHLVHQMQASCNKKMILNPSRLKTAAMIGRVLDFVLERALLSYTLHTPGALGFVCPRCHSAGNKGVVHRVFSMCFLQVQRSLTGGPIPRIPLGFRTQESCSDQHRSTKPRTILSKNDLFGRIEES